ncbi:MAG: CvpA family protein [Clostridia bacterium]
MSAILDIIIIIIVALTMFFAAKNGFIKTLFTGTSFFIAILVAYLLLTPTKQLFIDSSLANSAKSSLSTTLAGFVESGTDDFDPNQLIENENFKTLINVFGIDEADLSQKVTEWRKDNTEHFREYLVDYVSEPIINSVVTVLAFLILFLGTLLICKLVTYILDRVFTLPVLKQANKLLGVILGIVIAAVRVYLFCALLDLIIPFGTQLGWKFVSDLKVGDTLIYQWFHVHNLFSAFFG